MKGNSYPPVPSWKKAEGAAATPALPSVGISDQNPHVKYRLSKAVHTLKCQINGRGSQ